MRACVNGWNILWNIHGGWFTFCLKCLLPSPSQCSPNELTNAVISSCFVLLFRDLIRLFACYNDGIINMLGKTVKNVERNWMIFTNEFFFQKFFVKNSRMERKFCVTFFLIFSRRKILWHEQKVMQRCPGHLQAISGADGQGGELSQGGRERRHTQGRNPRPHQGISFETNFSTNNFPFSYHFFRFLGAGKFIGCSGAAPWPLGRRKETRGDAARWRHCVSRRFYISIEKPSLLYSFGRFSSFIWDDLSIWVGCSLDFLRSLSLSVDSWLIDWLDCLIDWLIDWLIDGLD